MCICIYIITKRMRKIRLICFIQYGMRFDSLRTQSYLYSSRCHVSVMFQTRNNIHDVSFMEMPTLQSGSLHSSGPKSSSRHFLRENIGCHAETTHLYMRTYMYMYVYTYIYICVKLINVHIC